MRGLVVGLRFGQHQFRRLDFLGGSMMGLISVS